MTSEEKARKWTQCLLARHGIRIGDIAGFEFMKRYTPDGNTHSRRNKYGAGILTLHLGNGTERVLILHRRHRPGRVVQCLCMEQIPFLNLDTGLKAAKPVAGKTTFRRPSLYMFWNAVLCLVCIWLAFLAMYSEGRVTPYLCIPLFAVAAYELYILQTRFCHITLTGDEMAVISLGRRVMLPYSCLLKVNFDFARERNFTHVLEVLDDEYRYYLFYIGGTPRTRLREITAMLRRAGVDATCSLNDKKRHYDDVYHVQ